jgi:DNA-binding NarL/FixJ family response regulator
MEHGVVRLVSEGVTNNDVAKGFSSHRGTHLTHVYTRLGLNFQVQLVKKAAHDASTPPRQLLAATPAGRLPQPR